MENKQQYIKLLVHPNSPIEQDRQKELINYLFDTFVQYSKDMLMISDGYISVIRSRNQFETLAEMNLKIKFPDDNARSYDKEKGKYRWNLKISEIFNTISVVNSFSLLRYQSNLFAPQQQIIKDDMTSTLTVIGNKLHIKKIENKGINKSDYLEIIRDYKNHFPYLDDLFKLVIDMRFAKARKASFLHLRVMSD